MYSAFLATHNILRWAVLILGIIAIVNYFLGWMGKKPFSAGDKRMGSFYTISLDIQFLIGLVLYFFLSPITKAAMSNMGTAMKDTVLRFWSVEHITMMVLALIVAHVGSVMSRKAPSDVAKYKTGFIYYAISFILILMAIPWPWRALIGRPLFPWM